MAETFSLISHGVKIDHLNKVIQNYGMPVGPITLVDEVGIDVANHVKEFLTAADMGVRMSVGDADGDVLGEMVEKGWLGKKTNKGFFIYEGKGGKKKTLNPEVVKRAAELVTMDHKLSDEDIRNRQMCRLVNEAVLCLQEGIISRPLDGDIGAVFGIGFLPWSGGPFRMLDANGIDKYTDMMQGYADKYGPQFEPCQLMKDMAKENKKFYP